MTKKSSKVSRTPCHEVAHGGVGESGASSMVTHQVTEKPSKLMVLRTTETSLCPNTGAAAMLVVDGTVEAAGDVTAEGSSVQAEAALGARVVGIVHTYPLFNDVHCIRLGELSFRLDECELTQATAASTTKLSSMVPCRDVETREWYAWNDLMPPKPDRLYVVGEVRVPNPGVTVELVPRVHQGEGKKSLGLELILTQCPGIRPQVMTWKQARYDRVLVGGKLAQVEIFCEDEKIEQIPVEDVS